MIDSIQCFYSSILFRSEVNFKNWGDGDPNNGERSKNEDCGVLKPDGKWNDFPCNHRFMYVCKKKMQ